MLHKIPKRHLFCGQTAATHQSDAPRPQVIDVTNAGTINALHQYTPDLIVICIVGRPQLRGYEVGCLPGQQSNGLTCSMLRGTVLLECEVAARH